MQEGLDTFTCDSFLGKDPKEEVLLLHAGHLELTNDLAQNLRAHCVHGVGLVQSRES